MRTELVSSTVPTIEICPNCKGEMTVTKLMPIFFADHLENITYRCKSCRSEMQRTFERSSRGWRLIRTNPDLQENPRVSVA
jgi:hypothetical protein